MAASDVASSNCQALGLGRIEAGGERGSSGWDVTRTLVVAAAGGAGGGPGGGAGQGLMDNARHVIKRI
jgi:hypothetical protein